MRGTTYFGTLANVLGSGRITFVDMRICAKSKPTHHLSRTFAENRPERNHKVWRGAMKARTVAKGSQRCKRPHAKAGRSKNSWHRELKETLNTLDETLDERAERTSLSLSNLSFSRRFH